VTFNRSLIVGLVLSAFAVSGAYAADPQPKSAFAAEENPTTVFKAGQAEVRCVDPHACCEESKQVLETLNKLIAAYAEGDIKAYEENVDDQCSMFDEGSKQLISGKANVIAALKQRFAENLPTGAHPLKAVSIEHPFAKVTNDTCVVTFFATKEIGGAHPHKERAHITDVFVKRGDKWKKLHWSGKWETFEG
jgi:hypothetical protein